MVNQSAVRLRQSNSDTTPDGSVELRNPGFFVMRSPLFPFEHLLSWANGSDGLSPDNAKDALVKGLRRIVADPIVLEALYLASPSVYEAAKAWLDTPLAPARKLERALVRYIQRMSGRSTPFGLFAGVSLGTASQDEATASQLRLLHRTHYKRYVRLDNDYLFTLIEFINRQDSIRRELMFRPNPSMYRLAGRWRYVRSAAVGRLVRHTLVAVDSDDPLEIALNRARAGARFDDLVESLLEMDPDIASDEASAYIDELIDQHVLLSNVGLTLTGDEPLDALVRDLRRLPSAAAIADRLDNVAAHIRTLSSAEIGTRTEAYSAVRTCLEALPVPVSPSRLLQVDLVKPAPGARLGPHVLDSIKEGIALLHRLSPPVVPEPIRRFREAFTARFERRAVPLLEALDEEHGIGFERSMAPSAENVPLLNGIPFGHQEGGPDGQRWTPRDAYLLRRIEELIRTGQWVLALTVDDADALATSELRPLPNALSALVLLADSDDASSSSQQVLIRHIQGPSGANLLGRFCHADSSLRDELRAHLHREQAAYADAILAEIVHLPEGRMANIVARPCLRSHELVYLGVSGAPPEHQIPASDLLVAVEDGQVILRSGRLGRRIVPRMATAHNYNRGQPVYRFLCYLQHQDGATSLGWQWGALECLPFLPRVTYRSVVLARARWRLDRSHLTSIVAAQGGRRPALQEWRRERQVPRHVLLVDGDNELPVDFENPLSVDTFCHLISRRPECVVAEMFPRPSQLCTVGPEGRFVHELIVPFTRGRSAGSTSPRDRAAGASRPSEIAGHRGDIGGVTPTEPLRTGLAAARNPADLADAAAATGRELTRSFAPGTEWHYVKIYTGTATVDRVLTATLRELIADLRGNGLIDRWFFVRYADPDWHLRLRLHGLTEAIRSSVRPRVEETAARLLGDGTSWKLQCDTYDREVERYGGPAGIESSETLFWIDSELVLDLLSALPAGKDADLRWRLCLFSWDRMLTGFGFTAEAKHVLAREHRDAYSRSLPVSKATAVAIGRRFRLERQSLERLIQGEPTDESLKPLLNMIEAGIERAAPGMHAVRTLSQKGQLSMPLASVAASHLHMHANRLLRSAHRYQECVLYDFLFRIYDSSLARRRRGIAAATPSSDQRSVDR